MGIFLDRELDNDPDCNLDQDPNNFALCKSGVLDKKMLKHFIYWIHSV